MRIILLTLCALLAAGNAVADVKREYKTSSTIARMGVNEAATTDFYSVDKHTAESNVKWTGGMMKTMTGGKAQEGATITRIDRDSIFTVDHRKETYSAMSFAELRKMIEEGMKSAEDAQPEEEEDEIDSTATADRYEWTFEDLSEPDAKVINGWNCRNIHVRSTGVNKDDPNDKVIISLVMWNSEEIPGKDEIAAYNQKYLTALGLNELALYEGLISSAFLYRDKLSDVVEAAKKAPGEPVINSMTVEHNRRKGKSLAQQAKEGAAEELAQKVPFGLGKKKKKDEAPVYVLKTVFSFNGELLSAATDAVDTAKFEVPAGYKFKKR